MRNLIIILLVFTLAACQPGNKNSQEKQATEQTQVAQATVNISGMHCENCVASVEKGIKELDGVVNVAVSLADSNAVVSFDPAKVDVEKIGKAIEGRGYAVKK